MDGQNVNADWIEGDHLRRVAVFFIAAVLTLASVAPVHAKHEPNPEARVAQKRAKQQQKELRKRANAQRKDSKRLELSRYTAVR